MKKRSQITAIKIQYSYQKQTRETNKEILILPLLKQSKLSQKNKLTLYKPIIRQW